MVASPIFQIFHLRDEKFEKLVTRVGKRAESRHMNRNQFHLGNRASPVNRDHVKRPLSWIIDAKLCLCCPLAWAHLFAKATAPPRAFGRPRRTWRHNHGNRYIQRSLFGWSLKVSYVIIAVITNAQKWTKPAPELRINF